MRPCTIRDINEADPYLGDGGLAPLRRGGFVSLPCAHQRTTQNPPPSPNLFKNTINPPATDHFVAVVENCRLPGSNGPLRFVEID